MWIWTPKRLKRANHDMRSKLFTPFTIYSPFIVINKIFAFHVPVCVWCGKCLCIVYVFVVFVGVDTGTAIFWQVTFARTRWRTIHRHGHSFSIDFRVDLLLILLWMFFYFLIKLNWFLYLLRMKMAWRCVSGRRRRESDESSLGWSLDSVVDGLRIA